MQLGMYHYQNHITVFHSNYLMSLVYQFTLLYLEFNFRLIKKKSRTEQ